MPRSVFCYFWCCFLLCALLSTFNPGSAWGDEPPFTEEQAQAAYEEAIALGDAGELEQAHRLIKPYAEAGFPRAQHLLGYMYINGEGVDKDYENAAKWFEKAAKQDFAVSFYALALMHQNGEYFSKSQLEAFKNFYSSATLGNTYGAYEVGRAYFYGWGTKKNYKLAEHWLLKAADRKDIDSQVLLSVLYNELGNEEERSKWLRAAAENGDKNSIVILWSDGDPWAATQLSIMEKACVTTQVLLDSIVEFDCFNS